MTKKRIFFRLTLVFSVGVLALGCRAGSAITDLFATATPTATATFTPSPTPTPTLTPTPRPTGVDTESQPDGSMLVRDFDNGYQVTLPPGWVIIPLTKEDLDRVIEQVAGEDPEFAKMAEAFRQAAPDFMRLIGLHGDRKYRSGQYPTLVSITVISDTVAGSMPMSFVTAMIEDNVMTGSKDTTWDVLENDHGIEIGIVQGSLKVPSVKGGTINAKTKVIAFQVNKKLIMVQFITPAEFGAEVLPAADQIIDTIRLLEP